MFTFINEFCYEISFVLGGFMAGMAVTMLLSCIGGHVDRKRRRNKRKVKGEASVIKVYVCDGNKEHIAHEK